MKQFHSFRLDIVNHCLWRGEDRVLLTPKAFVEHADRCSMRTFEVSLNMNHEWTVKFVEHRVADRCSPTYTCTTYSIYGWRSGARK
jgi:hypothetical protein